MPERRFLHAQVIRTCIVHSSEPSTRKYLGHRVGTEFLTDLRQVKLSQSE